MPCRCQIEELENRRLLSATAATDVIHTGALPVPEIVVRQTFNAPLAAIQGLTAGALSPLAVVHWGDGHTSKAYAAAQAGVSDQLLASAPHVYEKAGRYDATVVFREQRRVVGRVRQVITVLRSAGALTPATSVESKSTGITATAVTGTKFEGVLGTLNFKDPSSVFSVFSLQVGINWGDGMISPGQSAQVGDSQLEIVGAHVYSNPGRYSVHVFSMEGPFPLLPPPGQILPPYGIVEAPPGPTFNATIAVSGRPIVVPVPVVQVSAMSLPPVYPISSNVDASFSGPMATLSGIAPGPEDAEVYAVISWGDGTSADVLTSSSWWIPGSLVHEQNGTYLLSGFHNYERFSGGHFVSPAGTYQVNITFKLNDHADGSQNSVLGSLGETLTVLPNSGTG